MPVEDADVSAFLEKSLTKQGMTIMTGAGVESLQATATAVSASIKGKDGKVVTSEFTHCIVAIGIVPNTENIGLEALGVEMDRGFLKTDTNCRTNVPGLWAIGDITAPPWLAHKASHEGVIAAETIAGGHPHAMDPLNIPGCTYCHPQVASVGLTEAKAKEAAEAEAQAIADAAAALAAEGAALEGEGALAEGAAADEPASTEIVMQEGESLADVKERMKREQAKAKKPTIPPELLNNANSYEDKVGVVRMVVQNDQSRVAGVIRSMIQT